MDLDSFESILLSENETTDIAYEEPKAVAIIKRSTPASINARTSRSLEESVSDGRSCDVRSKVSRSYEADTFLSKSLSNKSLFSSIELSTRRGGDGTSSTTRPTKRYESPIVEKRISYVVVQTRSVALTDVVVAAFTDRKLAEKYVIRQCHQYGDGYSQLTGSHIPFASYEEYETCSGLPFYMIPNTPALKIIECPLNPLPH